LRRGVQQCIDAGFTAHAGTASTAKSVVAEELSGIPFQDTLEPSLGAR
jgi:hypothetical protein